MEKKLTEAFHAVRMDECCIERIENAMQNPVKAHSPTHHILRAIAVACLCLMLPVSVLGIQKLVKPVELGEQTVNEDNASYKVVADVIQWSVENLGDELRFDLEKGGIQQVFDNKKSLEEYLGLMLIDSPILEEAPIVDDLAESFAHGFKLRPQLSLDPSARYILTASDWDGNTATENADVLKVSCHRVFENTELYLDAWVILDSVSREELDNGILGENFLPVHGIMHEFVLDENGYYLLDKQGNPVVNQTQFTSTDYTFISTEYKMANGCTATVITARFNEPDGTQGHREFMGYFIQNGILYTIRPYAIYDPTLSYPSSDLDARNVLYKALDTFQ